MSKPRRLSGREAVRILSLFGFEQVAQRGSHMKLRRLQPGGSKQTLTVPNHSELDIGTVRAIYRQALRYVEEARLRPYFFTD